MPAFVLKGVNITKGRLRELVPMYGMLNRTVLKLPAPPNGPGPVAPMRCRFETFAHTTASEDGLLHGELRFETFPDDQTGEVAELNDVLATERAERPEPRPAPSPAPANQR